MKRAFTLIELIVVIIIVGILAAIGTVQYNKTIERSRGAEAKNILGSLKRAQESYYLESGVYAVLGDLAVTVPSTCTTTYYFSYLCETNTGKCTATRCLSGGKTPNYTTAFWYALDPAGIWSQGNGAP